MPLTSPGLTAFGGGAMDSESREGGAGDEGNSVHPNAAAGACEDADIRDTALRGDSISSCLMTSCVRRRSSSASCFVCAET